MKKMENQTYQDTIDIQCPNQGCVNGACPQCRGTRNPGCSCEGTGKCNTCEGSGILTVQVSDHPKDLESSLDHALDHGFDVRFPKIWETLAKSPNIINKLHSAMHQESNKDNNPRDWHHHEGYPVKKMAGLERIYTNIQDFNPERLESRFKLAQDFADENGWWVVTGEVRGLKSDGTFYPPIKHAWCVNDKDDVVYEPLSGSFIYEGTFKTAFNPKISKPSFRVMSLKDEPVEPEFLEELRKTGQDGSGGGDSGSSGGSGNDSSGGDSYGGGAPDTGAGASLGEFSPGSGQQGPNKEIEGSHCPRCGGDTYVIDGYFVSCPDCGWTKRSQKKSGSWSDILDKSKRLRADKKVNIINIEPDVIVGTVVGDHGQYQVELWRQFPGSWSVTLWSCTCPWGDWAFKRQKTYIGRLCSHAVAVLHQAHSMEYRKDSEFYKDVSKAASVLEEMRKISKSCNTCHGAEFIFDDDDVPMECPECTNPSMKDKRTPGRGSEDDPLGPYRDIGSSGYTEFADDIDYECKDNGCEFSDVPHLMSECEEVKADAGKTYEGYWGDDDDNDYYTSGGGSSLDKQDWGKNKKNWTKYVEPDPEDYVKDVKAGPKRKGLEWMDYDTRWFNEDTNKDVLDTVEHLTNRYPVTKDWFKGLHVSADGPVTVPRDRKIFLSPWGLDKPGEDSWRPKKKDKNKKEKEDDGLELDWLTAHEFGHVLHTAINGHAVGHDKLPDLGIEELKARKYNDEQMRFSESKATQAIDSAKGKFGEIKDAAPSSYGGTDELEYFAEAMSDTWTNNKPHEISSHIAGMIDSEFMVDTGQKVKKRDPIKYTPMPKKNKDDKVERDKYGDAIDPVVYNHENGFHQGNPKAHCLDCQADKKPQKKEPKKDIVETEIDPQTGIYVPKSVSDSRNKATDESLTKAQKKLDKEHRRGLHNDATDYVVNNCPKCKPKTSANTYKPGEEKRTEDKTPEERGKEEEFMTCEQGHKHWGLYGAAGALFRTQSKDGDYKYLLQLRSHEVQHPLTWSIPGGAIRPDEQPIDAAKREATEEIGGPPDTFVGGYNAQDCGDWKYHTYVFDVDHEFTPSVEPGWETAMTRWVSKDDMDNLKLHPGFQKWKEQNLDAS